MNIFFVFLFNLIFDNLIKFIILKGGKKQIFYKLKNLSTLINYFIKVDIFDLIFFL